MTQIPFPDALALAWFLACWAGYTVFVERPRKGVHTTITAMHAYRLRWMQRMLTREMHMEDAIIAANLMRSVAFFASTSIFILAGLVTVLGAIDQANVVVSRLPFAVETSNVLWELKLVVLLVIFIYAFFKFTWSLRQFNYLCIVIGGAPHPGEATQADADYAERAALIGTTAAKHLNRGMRAYYFGLASLSWFIHPALFAAATIWVVLVLYRRECRSNLLKALGYIEGRPSV